MAIDLFDNGNNIGEPAPYRFAWSPSGEVFVLALFPQVGISMVFKNVDTFSQFIDAASEARSRFIPKAVREAEEILRAKTEEKGEG